jgi:hypothetical protein
MAIADPELKSLKRIRAWYCVYCVARSVAMGDPLEVVRQLLIDALEAVDEALK